VKAAPPVIAIGAGAWMLYDIIDLARKHGKEGLIRGRKFLKNGRKMIWPVGVGLRQNMPDLYKKQKGRDGLCGHPLPPLHIWRRGQRIFNPAIEVDHIIPHARGGSDDVANLQLTLGTYNRQKGDRPWGPRERQLYCPL